jgi:hypothetical protein
VIVGPTVAILWWQMAQGRGFHIPIMVLGFEVWLLLMTAYEAVQWWRRR